MPGLIIRKGSPLVRKQSETDSIMTQNSRETQTTEEDFVVKEKKVYTWSEIRSSVMRA